MGWSTDWLYALLLNRARADWAVARQAAQRWQQPVPECLVAAEYGACVPERSLPRGPIVRRWTSRDDFAAVSGPPPSPRRPPNAPTRRLFAVPQFGWYVEPSRRRVLICRCIGPLWAEGGWWDVMGQGTRGALRGRLERSGGLHWTS